MTTLEAVLTGVIAVLLAAVAAKSRMKEDLRGGPRSADEATFATLHIAGRAAPHLRAGLSRESARKAVRHLRLLLGCDAVVITSTRRVLAWDGPSKKDDDEALRLASGALRTGRTEVDNNGAVAAPLLVDGTVVGAVVAYDEKVSAVLVRTAGEVARWVSGQLELSGLDASRARAIEAEMRMLRAQISPHFIYNSLTAIASFVRTDPERARDLLLDFADFARYTFRTPRDFVTLADELTCIDRYLLLERARFGNRLRFAVQVAPEVLPVVVPFLCLQPLVENAIRHGMEGRAGPGQVTISARDAGPEAHISVEDNGRGMDPERLRALLGGHAEGERAHGRHPEDRRARAGRHADGCSEDERHGIGLANVDARLRQAYGPDYGLAAETAPGAGTKVMMRVPKYQPGVVLD